MPFFNNRRDAGRKLSLELFGRRLKSPVIVALSHGGIPVAFEIAHRLQAPMIALSDEGLPVDLPQIQGRSVILVDDGLAASGNILKHSRWLTEEHAQQRILAVPVCSQLSIQTVRGWFDEVVCLEMPETLESVESAYHDSCLPSQEELVRMLEVSRETVAQEVRIEMADGTPVEGLLQIPPSARGIVLCADIRAQSLFHDLEAEFVRHGLHAGIGALWVDLKCSEANPMAASRHWIELTAWLAGHARISHVPLGYFATGWNGTAAILAGAELGERVSAIACCATQVDLDSATLSRIRSSVLFIAGEKDAPAVESNRDAIRSLHQAELVVLPETGHLFEEVESRARLLRHLDRWFHDQFQQRENSRAA